MVRTPQRSNKAITRARPSFHQMESNSPKVKVNNNLLQMVKSRQQSNRLLRKVINSQQMANSLLMHSPKTPPLVMERGSKQGMHPLMYHRTLMMVF